MHSEESRTEKCPECGGIMHLTNTPMKGRYHGETFVIDGIERLECEDCGESLIDFENSNKLDSALKAEYEKRHALLSPKEIRSIRTRLGMSQSDFEKVLGVKSPTCSRWENGKVQQSAVADGLIRAVAASRDVLAMLCERRGVSLDEPVGKRDNVLMFDDFGHQNSMVSTVWRDEEEEM